MRWRAWTSSLVTGLCRPASPAIGRYRRARRAQAPAARSRFEWALGGQFLVSHRGTDPRSAGQPGDRRHRPADRRLHPALLRLPRGGAPVRDELCRWSLDAHAGVAHFSPLDFRQRFTGTFSEDENTITGAWEKSPGGDWEHDFALTYRRAG